MNPGKKPLSSTCFVFAADILQRERIRREAGEGMNCGIVGEGLSRRFHQVTGAIRRRHFTVPLLRPRNQVSYAVFTCVSRLDHLQNTTSLKPAYGNTHALNKIIHFDLQLILTMPSYRGVTVRLQSQYDIKTIVCTTKQIVQSKI